MVWSKCEIRSQREAQSLADQFMVEVNSRNNQPEIMLVVLDTVKRYMNPVKGSRGHTSKTQRKDLRSKIRSLYKSTTAGEDGHNESRHPSPAWTQRRHQQRRQSEDSANLKGRLLPFAAHYSI